jgi:hypothetical protein
MISALGYWPTLTQVATLALGDGGDVFVMEESRVMLNVFSCSLDDVFGVSWPCVFKGNKSTRSKGRQKEVAMGGPGTALFRLATGLLTVGVRDTWSS